MQFCTPHWEILKAEIHKLSLAEWVAPSAETAAMQVANQVELGEATPINYDPLMASHFMIIDRAFQIIGPSIFDLKFGCPICFLNRSRTLDGTCPRNNDDCDLKTPGSIPDFDTWLTGPDSAPAASKEFMISEGWIRPND